MSSFVMGISHDEKFPESSVSFNSNELQYRATISFVDCGSFILTIDVSERDYPIINWL